jgi:hypothetical protein
VWPFQAGDVGLQEIGNASRRLALRRRIEPYTIDANIGTSRTSGYFAVALSAVSIRAAYATASRQDYTELPLPTSSTGQYSASHFGATLHCDEMVARFLQHRFALLMTQAEMLTLLRRLV